MYKTFINGLNLMIRFRSMRLSTQLPYILFSNAFAKKVVKLESLPPTTSTDAARLHSYRVYLIVQKWFGSDLNPTLWGWKHCDNAYKPIETTQSPMPPQLMKTFFL